MVPGNGQSLTAVSTSLNSSSPTPKFDFFFWKGNDTKTIKLEAEILYPSVSWCCVGVHIRKMMIVILKLEKYDHTQDSYSL